jgi:SRSO17 transposase
VSGTAEAIAAALPASRWGRRSAGAGGPRLYDYLELADLDARAFFDCRSASTMWTRGLLIRRGLSDAKMAFFSTWCPKGTPMAVLVEVEGRRWAIEDAFETAKTELAHNETRSWHGWHRHVSLVMLAFALLMVIRHKADTSPQKRPPTEQHKLCGPSRRSVVLPGV